MPQLQVVDFNSRQPQQPSGLERVLSGFSEQLSQNQEKQRDAAAFENLYKKYQQEGMGIEGKIQAIRSDPRMSPTAKVAALDDLKTVAGINEKLQKQTKEDLERANKKNIVRDVEKRRGLEPGALEPYEDDPKMAEQITRPPKESKKTQASQPIDPEQQKNIQAVEETSEFQSASNPEKQRLLRVGNVSKENIDSIMKPYIEEEKNRPGSEYEKLREKSIGEYVNKAFSDRDAAEDLKFSFDEAEKAINGDISGPGIYGLLKNNPYSSILIGLTPDEASLQATNKKFLEGNKGIFGAKPTEREIFLLLNDMLPSIGKSREANLASLSFMKRINEMKIMHSDLIDELTEGGKKYVPDLERQVNAKMRPYGEQLRQDMIQANAALKQVESQKGDQNKGAAKIKVKAPNGQIGYMTKEQIEKAKEQNVIFTPIK